MYQATNGEIYNYNELKCELQKDFAMAAEERAPSQEVVIAKGLFASAPQPLLHAGITRDLRLDDIEDGRDCYVIGKMVLCRGYEDTFNRLHGEFAIVLVYNNLVILARDRYGVRPLFYGYDALNGNLVAASTPECFATSRNVELLKPFPPGHYLVWNATTGEENIQPFQPFLLAADNLWPQASLSEKAARLFYHACKVRCLQQDKGDTATAVLLSGGLDSSVVLCMAVHFLGASNVVAITAGKDTADVRFAASLCRELGVECHFVYELTPPTVAFVTKAISCLCSYDRTTVRAGSAQYQLCQASHLDLRRNKVKVVLCGEGADELAQGYQYFKLAPNAEAADDECKRLLNDIYLFDGLRVDRTTASVGLEVRLPFLDTAFVDGYLRLGNDVRHNTKTEKLALRQMVAEELVQMVPELRGEASQATIWRPKEAFSDSVGRNWANDLRALAADQISDAMFSKRQEMYPHNTPTTKEAFLYRVIFHQSMLAPAEEIPYEWMPRWSDVGDPSATVLSCYKSGGD